MGQISDTSEMCIVGVPPGRRRLGNAGLVHIVEYSGQEPPTYTGKGIRTTYSLTNLLLFYLMFNGT